MALIKLSTLVTGGDSCFCNGQTLTTLASEYQDSSCDRLRNVDAVMECRIVSTQMVPTSITTQNLYLTFFDTIPAAAAAGRNLFGAAKCKREPILELDIGGLRYIPQKPLARSLEGYKSKQAQEQDQHHGRSTPGKTLFSKSIKCKEEIRLEIGGGTAARKHAVPRDSRGGSSSSELRDDTKVHPRACVLDCQVAGVELKTNQVADGPSPSASPAGGSQQTVQFSQCGKEIYLVQIVQILFWGKRRAKVAIF